MLSVVAVSPVADVPLNVSTDDVAVGVEPSPIFIFPALAPFLPDDSLASAIISTPTSPPLFLSVDAPSVDFGKVSAIFVFELVNNPVIASFNFALFFF